MKNQPPPLKEDVVDKSSYARKSRRSLIVAGVSALVGLLGFEWLKHADQDRGLSRILRRGLDAGDELSKSVFRDAQAPTKGAAAKPIRTNGDAGLEDEIDAKKWRLKLSDPKLAEPLMLTIEDIKRLPVVETAFEFKCIEGWSQNVQCKGARFSDFMREYNVGQSETPFASLTSINGGYYVSMDMKSLLHPQTLLCYEMSGEALQPENGFPLRLMTPVKYGVKNIKQIGEIAFTDELPDDYWAERGYSDYDGL